MNQLEFDRDAVGIRARSDWTDNQTFINISAGIKEHSNAPTSKVSNLPVDTVGGTGRTTNDGTKKLKNETKLFIDTMTQVALEFSDACALLGSGAESAIENTDAAEAEVTANFEFLMSDKPV